LGAAIASRGLVLLSGEGRNGAVNEIPSNF
jgi:hypothetical protein